MTDEEIVRAVQSAREAYERHKIARREHRAFYDRVGAGGEYKEEKRDADNRYNDSLDARCIAAFRVLELMMGDDVRLVTLLYGDHHDE